jgi:hypothetical protein
MNNEIDLVQAGTEETRSAVDIGVGSNSQHSNSSDNIVESKAAQIPTTQRCPDEPSVQKSGTSSVVGTTLDPSTNNQQQGIKKSQPKRQNSALVSNAEVDADSKKTKPRLRKGKWTVRINRVCSRTKRCDRTEDE